MNSYNYKKEDVECDDNYGHSSFDNEEEVYSKVVRAGRRTYFFDVKATRANDYYLTVTESRKKQLTDGSVSYEKHKLFLYKEDFLKFMDGLNDVVDFVKKNKPEFFEQENPQTNSSGDDEFERL